MNDQQPTTNHQPLPTINHSQPSTKHMNYLVTGAAGFIGARTCEFLLDAGHHVVGVDNLNNYYDVRLKEHRLDQLKQREGFLFFKVDIEHKDALDVLFMHHQFDAVINLGARAGVRYSVENPYVYMMTNAQGTLHLMENMRPIHVSVRRRFIPVSHLTPMTCTVDVIRVRESKFTHACGL